MSGTTLTEVYFLLKAGGVTSDTLIIFPLFAVVKNIHEGTA